MFKLTSTTYNIRHYNEIKRYFDKGSKILHIVNANQNINKNIDYSLDSKIETKYIIQIKKLMNLPSLKKDSF